MVASANLTDDEQRDEKTEEENHSQGPTQSEPSFDLERPSTSWRWRWYEALRQAMKGSPSLRRQLIKRILVLLLTASTATAIFIWWRKRIVSQRRRLSWSPLPSTSIRFESIPHVDGASSSPMLALATKSLTLPEVANMKRHAARVPLSLLYQHVEKGLVQRAIWGQGTVYFASSNDEERHPFGPSTKWQQVLLPADENKALQLDLFNRLARQCADFQILPSHLTRSWRDLSTPLLAALPFIYLGLLYRMMKNMTGGGDILAQTLDSNTASTGVTFADVAGIDTAAQEVEEVVNYLRCPSTYHRLGARPPRGILLYGPPGSGKTLLARAVAGEASVDCFLACSASSFVEMYVGRGAARVRALFAQARSEAIRRHRQRFLSCSPNARLLNYLPEWLGQSLLPLWQRARVQQDLGSTEARPLHSQATAILFIDELDALAKKRSSWTNNDEREQTLNQLLTEMDGFDQRSGNDVTLVVMAASNRSDVLDPAILRRFDRQIAVDYPDQAGRNAIMQVHARRIQIDQIVDWETLAAENHTGNFSGADLENLVNEAALLAVRDRAAQVQQHHLERAASRIRQMKVNLRDHGGSAMLNLTELEVS